MLARDQLGQIGALLFFRAIAANLVDAQVGMRTIREADRRRRARDLFHRNDVREIAHRAAAVAFFNGHPQETQLAHLAPQVHRELIGAVDLSRARRDLGLCKLAHGIAQGGDVLAMIESQARQIDHSSPLVCYVRVLAQAARRARAGDGFCLGSSSIR